MTTSSSSQQAQQRVLLESGTNEVEFLEFYIGHGRYGVNVAKVNQVMVLSDVDIAEIPGNDDPASVGMAMFRDEPILVLDLAKALHLEADQIIDTQNNRQLLLVLEFNQRVTGFVVDRVNAIRRISWDQFMKTDDASLGKQTEWVTGLFKNDSGMTLILDFESLLGEYIPSITPERYAENITEIDAAKSDELSILYCEDSDIVQRVALKSFDAAGFKNITSFTSGQQAIDFLKKNPDASFDIIVSDIEMPGMDGLTLCKQLQQDSRYASIPFVFFSSTINDQMKKKCLSVGANGAYSKPEIHRLIEALQDILGEKA